MNPSGSILGYKQPGTKMSSRFYFSHRQVREMTKHEQQGEQQWRGGLYHPAPQPKLPRRAIKTCTHPKMIDDSYGGPDSGCMAAHCPRCGYSFHHTLY